MLKSIVGVTATNNQNSLAIKLYFYIIYKRLHPSHTLLVTFAIWERINHAIGTVGFNYIYGFKSEVFVITFAKTAIAKDLICIGGSYLVPHRNRCRLIGTA